MRSRRWIFFSLWGVALAFLVIVWIISASLMERGRSDAIEHYKTRATLTAGSAETIVNRTFLAMDVLLAGLEDLAQPGGVENGVPDAKRSQSVLVNAVRRTLFVRDIALVSRDGTVVAAALPTTMRTGLEFPNGFVETTLDQETPSLSVSQPIESFTSREMVLYFARPLGTLAAVAVVPLRQLANALSPTGTAEPLTITLERDDGQLIVSEPPSGFPAAQRVAQPLQPEHRDGNARIARGRIDGAPSLVAARDLLHAGLVLAVSIPVSPVDARWHEDRALVLSVSAVLGIVILTTAAVTHWYIRRLELARQAIQDNKDWLDQALASIRDGLLLCDSKDRVVAWNRRYVEFFPYLAPVLRPGVHYDLLARTAMRAMQPRSTDTEVEVAVQRRLADRRGRRVESEYQIRPDLHVHITETETPSGGVVSVYRDTTRSERELARCREAVRAAEEAHMQSIATLCRQICEPANTALGMMQLVLRASMDDATRRYASWAGDASRQVLATVSNVLDMSRLTSDVTQFDFESFVPRALIEDVASRALDAADGRRFSVHFSPELPQALWGDARRLRHALFNLLKVAIERSSCRTIEVRADHESRGDGQAVLRVDLGVAGADATNCPEFHSLREVFQRLDPSEPAALALGLTRKVAELTGGGLFFDDSPSPRVSFKAVFTTVSELQVTLGGPIGASG
ncbi:PAS-domain containing protein [Caldimonas brevitalea]|uniref:histidine kinase n=1 Tax=Caldimonas brevitalea TaxID=413882 RepID=A0A0G3BGG7_9BURK|nr:PAS-domain containing protein [Caldimonas brevitalea]AKJ27068.1 diguanylate cyclase/phosphodiesterase [Caldimonas brevitalea]